MDGDRISVGVSNKHFVGVMGNFWILRSSVLMRNGGRRIRCNGMRGNNRGGRGSWGCQRSRFGARGMKLSQF